MPTNNAINLSAAGVTYYNGSGVFTAAAPGAAGIPLISAGAGTTPTFGTALVTGGGTGSTSFTSNGIVVSGATPTTALTSVALTNGQLLIGSTSAAPVAATLTAGTGITIGNAAGSITINASGGGLTWTEVTGTSQAMAINNGYLANNAGLVTLTLPSSAVQFSTLAIVGKGAGGWRIAQNANQQIIFGSSATTVGVTGSLNSSNANDVVYLLATTGGANTIWTVTDSIGNLTLLP